MNRSKLLSIAVIGLLMINLGTLALLYFSRHEAHERGRRPPHERGEGPRKMIIERLGFDEKQQESYEVLIKEHRDSRQRLNEENHKLHDALFALLKESTVLVTSKDSLMAEIALNQKNMDDLNFAHFQKIRALCKDDQLKKFNVLVDDLSDLFKPSGPRH